MKTRQEKRGQYERERKKKFRHLKNTGMLSNYYKQIKEYGKTNQKTKTQDIGTMEEVIKQKAGMLTDEAKVNIEKAEEIKPRKIMNKLLFFLPADSKWSRIIRRGIVIFLLAGISGVGVEIVQNSGSYIPAVWLPLITSLLAMIDKAWRELAKE